MPAAADLSTETNQNGGSFASAATAAYIQLDRQKVYLVEHLGVDTTAGLATADTTPIVLCNGGADGSTVPVFTERGANRLILMSGKSTLIGPAWGTVGYITGDGKAPLFNIVPSRTTMGQF